MARRRRRQKKARPARPHTIANAPTPMPTFAPTGRPFEAVPVLVLVGKEVGIAEELVMLMSPGLEVVTELKVVEAGMDPVLVALPYPPVVVVNKCVLNH